MSNEDKVKIVLLSVLAVAVIKLISFGVVYA